MTKSTNTLTQQDLAQFHGDLERYRHTFNRRVIYTPGVQYVAEVGGAYWLIDAIASYLTPGGLCDAARFDQRVADLHFWSLTVREDRSALLEARVDSPCKPFITQVIPYTDFPLDSVRIWAGYDSRFWTLYLPSEH